MPNHNARDFESASELSRRLTLPFQNLSLLTRALTHRSYVNENPNSVEDNERLEFLGDAVLDFIVGAWVYNRFPEMREGELTKIRSAIVRNDQLAVFARRLNLGPALRLRPAFLFGHVPASLEVTGGKRPQGTCVDAFQRHAYRARR